jgi:hypothetical protein
MSASRGRARPELVAASLLAIALAVAVVHAPGMTDCLACLAPAVLAVLLLWLGRFPGERAMLARTRSVRPRRARRRAAGRRPGDTRMPRGGALIAAALAGRAPPLAARL